MPRVLQVTTSFETGAIPNILLDLAPYWRQAGWDVAFLTLEALPETEGSVRRCRELGFPLHGLGLSPRATLTALPTLARAVKSHQPDLIHTHLGRADVYVPWVKGRVPQVSTFHSVKRNAGRLTRWGWKLSDGRVAHRTAVSQASADSFYADGWLSSPHSVITNPVSEERLRPAAPRADLRRAFGCSAEDQVLLAVGRLVPVKGHAQLIEAAALLRPAHPRLRVLIAGEGPERGRLQALIGQRGLDDVVTLLGGGAAVADLYAAADLLVFPSHWEGLGLVPLEALLLGCPVVSADLPAVREFLTQGQTGRFFRPNDPDDLARVVGAQLADPDGRRAQAERGQALVRERFAPGPIADQYRALYEQVLRA